MQRDLVVFGCGAACGQGLRTQRSMRMDFLVSAPSLTGTVRLLNLPTKLNEDSSERAHSLGYSQVIVIAS